MKSILNILMTLPLLLSFAISTSAQTNSNRTANQGKTLTWTEVAQKVKTLNYTIEENRIRVNQSKEQAKYARLSLLPKLNLWKLLDFSSDTKGIFGFIEDLVPFLIPANWSRAKQAEILSTASLDSYQSLWGNEVLNAKILYTSILNDKNLLAQLKNNQKIIQDLYQLAEARSEFGHDEMMIKNHLKSLLLQNNEDMLVLNQTLKEEKMRLLYLMTLPVETKFELTSIQDKKAPALKSKDVVAIIDRSPEILLYDKLIQVSGLLKEEIYFSFLGGSSISRGFAGGVFDNVPTDGGLGFATPTQIKIAKDQTAILTKQKEAALAMIKMQYTSAQEVNTNLAEQLTAAKEIYQFSIQRVENLKDKMYLGQKINLAEFSDALLGLSKSTAQLYVIQYQMKQNQYKMDRILWLSDFKDRPSNIPENVSNTPTKPTKKEAQTPSPSPTSPPQFDWPGWGNSNSGG